MQHPILEAVNNVVVGTFGHGDVTLRARWSAGERCMGRWKTRSTRSWYIWDAHYFISWGSVRLQDRRLQLDEKIENEILALQAEQVVQRKQYEGQRPSEAFAVKTVGINQGYHKYEMTTLASLVVDRRVGQFEFAKEAAPQSKATRHRSPIYGCHGFTSVAENANSG